MSSLAENPILIDEEQDKENFPHLLTTPISETSTQPPVLIRSCPFGTRNESVHDYVSKKLFEYFILSLLLMYFHINSNKRFLFYHILLQKLVRHI